MKKYKEFINEARDQINEISISTKIQALERMMAMADSMEKSMDDYYGPDEMTVKLYKKRAAKMLSAIRRKHGDTVANQAKDAFIKRIARDDLKFKGDELAWEADKYKDPKIMKGGPRKGKLSKKDQEMRVFHKRIKSRRKTRK